MRAEYTAGSKNESISVYLAQLSVRAPEPVLETDVDLQEPRRLRHAPKFRPILPVLQRLAHFPRLADRNTCSIASAAILQFPVRQFP
jgi:hypothetical protein